LLISIYKGELCSPDFSIRNDYRRMPYDLVPQSKALLELLGDGIFSKIGIFDGHYRVVPVWIKRLADSLDPLDAHVFKDLCKPCHRHLDALVERLVGTLHFQGAFQIVIYREQPGHRVGTGALVSSLALLGAALAVIIVLCREPKVSVALTRKLFLRRDFRGGIAGAARCAFAVFWLFAVFAAFRAAAYCDLFLFCAFTAL